MMKAVIAATAFVLLGACSAPEVKKVETVPAPPAAATITQFYVSPATIAKGDKALLCYGVEGAVAVRLDPPVDEITPSLARCLEVTPAATSTYTLFAKNRAGAEVSKPVQVIVDPKLRRAVTERGGGLILFFTAAQGKVKKGTPVMLCYGVKGATTVSISPAVQALMPSERICFQTTPEATTSYVLTAKSADGGTDTETVRIAVDP